MLTHSNIFLIGVIGLPIRIKNNQTEFFLTQRYSPTKPNFHNKWQLAGGGMEFGENPEETLHREFIEEVGEDITIIHPTSIAKTQIWPNEDPKVKGDVHFLLLAYLCKFKGKEPTKIYDPDHETNAMGWFAYDQIKNLDCLPKTHDYVDVFSKIIPNIDFTKF